MVVENSLKLNQIREFRHFPLREAERKTRLSVREVVVTGARVSADGSSGSTSHASCVLAALGALGPVSSLSSTPRPPLLASHFRAATSRSRTSRNSLSSAGAGRGCIAWDELPTITAAEAAAFCFNMVQSNV